MNVDRGPVPGSVITIDELWWTYYELGVVDRFLAKFVKIPLSVPFSLQAQKTSVYQTFANILQTFFTNILPNIFHKHFTKRFSNSMWILFFPSDMLNTIPNILFCLWIKMVFKVRVSAIWMNVFLGLSHVSMLLIFCVIFSC